MRGKLLTINNELKTIPKYLKYIFSGKKKAIYIGCLGHNNIGDDAVYKGVVEMTKSKIVLYPIDYAKVNAGSKLRKIYFPYPDFIIIGGGTIIRKKANESYLKLILDFSEKYPNAQIFSLGSGVANTEFAKKIGFPTDIEKWTETLNKCVFVSVRGSLSENILKNEWNVKTPVKILFDPALYLNQSKLKKNKIKTIGVNFCDIIGRIYGENQTEVALFAKDIVNKLLDNNWKVKLYPTTPNDVNYMKTILGNEIISKVFICNEYKSIEKSLDFFDSVDVFLGMRLHSNIFASLKSTPFFAIEYEQKTSDFLQSINLECCSIRTDELNVEKVFSEINNIYDNLDENQGKLFKLIQIAKNKQNKVIKDFINSL